MEILSEAPDIYESTRRGNIWGSSGELAQAAFASRPGNVWRIALED